jgi:hypothetical protein
VSATETRIKIGGVEKELPAGVEMLGEDDLFNVPFALLSIANEEEIVQITDSDYHWANPRHLGQTDGLMGRGFDKQDMEELYNDIRDEGLMFPLICRWVIRDDGSLDIQILDGERRWRCMDRQIKKSENVWSRKEKGFLPALTVHAKIPCRIITGNDKEALKIAFMVSDRSVGWGDGATAKLVKKLRKCGCTDKEILELTKKSFQWLKEQDEICQLDDMTFSYLTDGKINRALALRLAKIADIDRRHKYLHASYDDAVSTHQEELAKADQDLAKAEEKEELAEAELTEAQEKGDDKAIATAQQNLSRTQEKTQARRRQRSEASRPRAKTKNLRNAAAKIAEENEGEDQEDVAQPLRPGKIRKEVEALDALINNEGRDDDNKVIAAVGVLEAIRYCYKHNVLNGEEDIVKVLKRFRSLTILQQKRAAQVEAEAEEDSYADDDEDDDEWFSSDDEEDFDPDFNEDEEDED